VRFFPLRKEAPFIMPLHEERSYRQSSSSLGRGKDVTEKKGKWEKFLSTHLSCGGEPSHFTGGGGKGERSEKDLHRRIAFSILTGRERGKKGIPTM